MWFTPITLGMAALGWLITQSVTTVLAVLVVATPCPLILATPLAVICGINRADKESIIVKNGPAIEQIGRGRVVIFDKTGTITYGTPTVERIIPIDGEAEKILRMAASVEQLSSHSVAIALTREGEEKFGRLPTPTDFVEMPGQGVEGNFEGKHVVIGSQLLCESRMGKEFDSDAVRALAEVQKEEGGRLTSFVAIDGEPAGVVVFSDHIRPGVPAMIQRLRELGVEETVMLTGDNKVNANTIAREAGIGRAEANLLPAGKVEDVRILNER